MSERLLHLKRRYLLAEPSREVDGEVVFNAVRKVFERFYGVDDLAKSGLKRIKIDGSLVFSCYIDFLPRLILALTLVRNVNHGKIVLKTIRVSGTLKGLMSNYS